MNFKKISKVLIRITFVAASFCMVVANWNNGGFALMASSLFLTGNFLALVVNFV